MSKEDTKNKSRYFYEEHPKLCEVDDYWGQVRRTVNGKPVDQHQIDLIVSAIVSGLELQQNDKLLDLCCGNGALSRLIFDQCAGGIGVDRSEYLIKVAQDTFEKPGRESYILSDAIEFVKTCTETSQFTKALCYGSFTYFPKDSATNFLSCLRSRFKNLKRLFVGNLPNKAKMDIFFEGREYEAGVENNPESPVGIWWDYESVEALAIDTGWRVSFTVMPEDFYASHYRFDAILEPA